MPKVTQQNQSAYMYIRQPLPKVTQQNQSAYIRQPLPRVTQQNQPAYMYIRQPTILQYIHTERKKCSHNNDFFDKNILSFLPSAAQKILRHSAYHIPWNRVL